MTTEHKAITNFRSEFWRDGMMLSLGVFGATAYWFVRNVVHKYRLLQDSPFHKRRRKSLQDLNHESNSKSKSTTQARIGHVSTRGQTALVPALPYMKALLACFDDLCDAVHNRTGYIPLCIAENKLITQKLAQRCMQPSTTNNAFSDSLVYCYNSFLGMTLAREAAAYFLARRFYYCAPIVPEIAIATIQPKHVALSAGAAPILSHLFFVLGDAGDACLIPAPYYAAFDNDMNLLAGVIPFPIVQANPMQGPTEGELDMAFMQAKSNGLNPRFLLLTNPNNPLAVIYRRDVMIRSVQWSRKRGMQTIVDEIYALSTQEKQGHVFESIIKILDNELGTDVHMLWAASKDFGASGIRYGVLYTQNALLLQGLENIGSFTGVSGPIQYLMSEVLTDDVFVDEFLDASRDALLYSYNICTRKLDEMVLPFIPAEGGIFIYVDFSALLPQKTFEWEEKLSQLMFEVRIVLTPGDSQHDSHPGMFRICYAYVQPEVLEIAMERLSRLVAKLRRMDWEDLNGHALNRVIRG